MWWQDLELDTSATSAFSENGNRIRISSKVGDVIFNPSEDVTISRLSIMEFLLIFKYLLNCQILIKETVISRCFRIFRAQETWFLKIMVYYNFWLIYCIDFKLYQKVLNDNWGSPKRHPDPKCVRDHKNPIQNFHCPKWILRRESTP
jgi:hypothetical protein